MSETQEEIEAREAEEAAAAAKEGNGLDEKEQKIKELEEELEKEREKEKNFKSLKDAEKGKRKKIAERVDDMEAQLKQEREDRQTLQDSVMADAKGAALDQLAGEDKDLKQQLEERVKSSEAYMGAPKTSKELTERYEAAYSYLEGTQKRVNPLHAFSPVTGSQNELSRRDKRFTDTPDGKKLLEDKFPQIAALEKEEKK